MALRATVSVQAVAKPSAKPLVVRTPAGEARRHAAAPAGAAPPASGRFGWGADRRAEPPPAAVCCVATCLDTVPARSPARSRRRAP
jgi:hypothetical protein